MQYIAVRGVSMAMFGLHITGLVHSCVEVRAAIELSFNMVSGVTPDIHVLDGVYVPQVDWKG